MLRRTLSEIHKCMGEYTLASEPISLTAALFDGEQTRGRNTQTRHMHMYPKKVENQTKTAATMCGEGSLQQCRLASSVRV